jgi:hypothetical protein
LSVCTTSTACSFMTFLFYFLILNFCFMLFHNILLYLFSYFLTTHVTVSKLQKLLDSESMGYNPTTTDNQKTNPVSHSSSATQPDDLRRKVSICTNPALCPVSTSCYRILSSHAFLSLSLFPLYTRHFAAARPTGRERWDAWRLVSPLRSPLVPPFHTPKGPPYVGL